MNTSPASSSKWQILQDRATLLRKSREFFFTRNVVEVDTPHLSSNASIDAHIDLMEVITGDNTRYLQTSPEYCMKRLLSLGSQDIFQLGHVFRKGELGTKHAPEFTMCEWYRQNFSFEEMIEETIDYIRLFFTDFKVEKISYRDAFKKYAGFDIAHETISSLQKRLPTIDFAETIDDYLNVLIAEKVEPCFNKENVLTVLTHYPASQAALAKTKTIDNFSVAERFEIYYGGLELANGYSELIDVKEQRKRLDEENAKRLQLKKNKLPIDHYFLEALENGMPDCSGVAVGFDRLLMIRHQKIKIGDVLPFSWNEV